MSVPRVKLSQTLPSDFLIGHSIAPLAEATQNGREEGETGKLRELVFVFCMMKSEHRTSLQTLSSDICTRH